MNISATRGPIAFKFGFGSDRTGTLVSMATDSSHMVIMEELLSMNKQSYLSQDSLDHQGYVFLAL